MAHRPAIFPSAFHPHVGGVEELTRQLALEQTRRGMHPLIVTNQWPRDLPEVDVVDGLPVRRLPFRTPGIRVRQLAGWVIRGARTHKQTARILKDWDADVVHIQCVSNNAPFALRASSQLGIPLVVSAQGELTMDASHLYQRSSIARSILRRTLAEADVITGCSQYVLDQLDHFCKGKYVDKMRVVHNGIDLSECARATPEPRDRPYLLGLGRLVPQKGYDQLIRAFQLLASEFPNHELVIAGDGPESSQLQDIAVSLGLRSRVRFVGSVDHRRALSLMAGATAFALCSPNEPQGIVILEAMAVGSPVVASSGGGVPEIVHESNGLLFPFGDYRELARKLQVVLSDEATATELSLAGRTTAARFSWKSIAVQYEAAYRDAGSRDAFHS